jgi:hypothetical protein
MLIIIALALYSMLKGAQISDDEDVSHVSYVSFGCMIPYVAEPKVVWCSWYDIGPDQRSVSNDHCG